MRITESRLIHGIHDYLRSCSEERLMQLALEIFEGECTISPELDYDGERMFDFSPARYQSWFADVEGFNDSNC